jgi:hypothetical protein
MKLYDLKRGDKFVIVDDNPKVPVASVEAEQGKVYWFGHIDGMYSYCKDGDDVVHFAAWTEVERVAEMEK